MLCRKLEKNLPPPSLRMQHCLYVDDAKNRISQKNGVEGDSNRLVKPDTSLSIYDRFFWVSIIGLQFWYVIVSDINLHLYLALHSYLNYVVYIQQVDYYSFSSANLIHFQPKNTRICYIDLTKCYICFGMLQKNIIFASNHEKPTAKAKKRKMIQAA